MAVNENNEYRAFLTKMVRDWDREVWPTMKECGFTRDTAFISYLLMRVEQSVDSALYEEDPPKEPWQVTD